jgi:HSP20 family protein
VDFDRMHNEILRAFDETCQLAARQRTLSGTYVPPADAYLDEATRELVARIELPGVCLDDIELLADRRELVVRGERAFASGEGRVYQQLEMDYGRFERRLRFTVDVDPDAAVATYEAGILEVRLRLVERHDTGAQKVDIQKRGGAE